MTLDSLTITQPDDWHLHFRDGDLMRSVVPHTARQFARALVMPNLKPPVVNVEQALAYRARIKAAVPIGFAFEPLMTLYLTDNTTGSEIAKAKQTGVIPAVKYYPAGATTNSDSGVSDLRKAYPALEAMQREGMVLCVHGEVTDAGVDVFDREAVFVDKLLSQIVRDFPALKIVVEHITTRQAAQFVQSAGPNIAATITPQHLLYNRNAIFKGGIRPHFYCLPILKREEHRAALIAAATSGSPKFFLGTDSAPHTQSTKENACGCAGCFTAHAAMELYAMAFEAAGALDKLEGFASHHGAKFYGVPVNAKRVTLTRDAWTPQAHYAFGDEVVVPLAVGEVISWKLVQVFYNSI